ncbi:hypothetical protein SA496_16395 [Pseudomonas sp. JS3066]|jgi:hypothetical protein|uniref:hypothetical protein n=1 Tax=Pseudomonas sp. JS3066 TaxID=3090665 RepID=UPI002E7AC070|nr:hypothetical protein [Pseudomonas sp. JS3066]WVK91298.1 hypothetical protein SA496_16395 [Pseudomonas sp. JS3066]
MEENPYAAPRVELVEDAGPRQMNGWTPGHLRLLGWLSLACAVCTLILTGVALAAGATEDPLMTRLSDWIGVALTLLGCYLLIRLKLFAEARFSADGLAPPVWAVIIGSLAIEGLDFLMGDASTEPGWPMLFYFGAVAVLGALTGWLGVRLLKVQNAYPAFRVMGWLDLVGGIMMATIVLMLLGLLPLIAGNLAMMLVFFRGARELEPSS